MPRWKRQSLPSFRGPPCAHAPLSDPAGTSTPSHCGASIQPSVSITTSAPGYFISRLYHAANALAVYASPCLSPGQDAKLASGGWLAFAGWDSTHWVPLLLSRPPPADVPERPDFSWRTM